MLEEIYNQFKDAPALGSLINPGNNHSIGSMFEVKWEEVSPLLTEALSGEKDDEKTEMGVVAYGLAKAAKLLTGKYNWVITNVPYRSRNDLSTNVCGFIDNNYEHSKGNLATVFLERCIKFLCAGGAIAIVTLQDWLFQPTYKKLRKKLLKRNSWNFIGRLGAQAFQTPMWDFNVQLLLMTKGESFETNPQEISKDESNFIRGFDVSTVRPAVKKANLIGSIDLDSEKQEAQLNNPDAIITLREIDMSVLLSTFASSRQGISPADTAKYGRKYWEVPIGIKDWYYWQGTTRETHCYSGRDSILWFGEDLKNAIHNGIAYLRGEAAFGKQGVAISPTGILCSTLYTGEYFDDNVQIIVPQREEHIAAIWAYCSSEQYNADVRTIDQALKVRGALVKVPFDLGYWNKVAQEKYPNGLPRPYSNDSTQWIFHGHPAHSNEPLQVAVARLLGYRWPAEIDKKIELSDKQRSLAKKCDSLLTLSDEDGIVCIPSVRGEETAADRLRKILETAYGPMWSPTVEHDLIHKLGVNVSNLDEFLRGYFFEQHCKLFNHRPFIWHIWDGRSRDGFHALVNYHKLAGGDGQGRQLLENLTYSYLGDWIIRQREGVKIGEGGAEDRLASALELQKRLIAINGGETPFDIFVRWKPIEEQQIGWEPDINDGVRLNIRPFMTQDIQGGRKGSGILRWKPNIKWNKDRGKEPPRPQEQYPWFWNNGEFTGDRVNDIHLTNEEKRQARENAKKNQ